MADSIRFRAVILRREQIDRMGVFALYQVNMEAESIDMVCETLRRLTGCFGFVVRPGMSVTEGTGHVGNTFRRS
jgi:hypothetical protein